jgi:hypothetical protein
VAVVAGEADSMPVFRGRGVTRAAAATALVGWIGVGVGHGVARVETHFAYLTAFAFVVSIALGALIFLMTTYVVGAHWNAVIRRLNECVVSALPVLAVCFLPISFWLGDLYLWTAEPGALPQLSEHEAHALAHKQAYLNGPFFVARAALYFVIWGAAALVLCRRSAQRERLAPAADGAADAEGSAPHGRERAFSAALLPLVCLALTFAAFDWLMSLQPFWMSSIFGVYVFAGGFVASLGLVAVLAQAAARPGCAPIRPPHFHALGRLMFGFTIFWAYIAFFQALLIALPNRPEEVVFYLRRLEGGWRGVVWALIVGRFVLPFFILLPRAIKFRGGVLAWVGAGLVLGHYLDIYWLVMPMLEGRGPLPSVWDVSALLALGGTFSLAAASWLSGKTLVPARDPLLAASIAYRSPL